MVMVYPICKMCIKQRSSIFITFLREVWLNHASYWKSRYKQSNKRIFILVSSSAFLFEISQRTLSHWRRSVFELEENNSAQNNLLELLVPACSAQQSRRHIDCDYLYPIIAIPLIYPNPKGKVINCFYFYWSRAAKVQSVVLVPFEESSIKFLARGYQIFYNPNRKETSR